VTPEHVVPQVVEALVLAVERGLRLAVVYNTSAYDDLDSLRLLDGLVDVYMPDLKFWEGASAERYADAADYPAVARAAIVEMHRQVGDLVLDRAGTARRGLLVRHLVMPGLEAETRSCLDWLAREISPDTVVNVMDQYRPCHRVDAGRFPELDRRPTAGELRAARDAARAAGLWRLY
jgi:putative pyruvate formate lyase activating enzyme